jgi:hypothetical protein
LEHSLKGDVIPYFGQLFGIECRVYRGIERADRYSAQGDDFNLWTVLKG